MRVDMMSALRAAKPSSAIGAFTCYESTTAIAAVGSAEAAGTPVILLVPPSSLATTAGIRLISMLSGLADRSASDVCIQLDHATDLDDIRKALDSGVGAVMADGSHLPFKANVEFVQRAIALASTYGASVEAELGVLSGQEDRVTDVVAHGAMTNPADVRDYVEATGIDLLAISIGNRHGGPPLGPLDWQRLQDIAERAPIPLALHGASGLARDDLARAIASGVAKINVNTELRRTIFSVLTAHGAGLEPTADISSLVARMIEANTDTISMFLHHFGVLAPRDRVAP